MCEGRPTSYIKIAAKLILSLLIVCKFAIPANAQNTCVFQIPEKTVQANAFYNHKDSSIIDKDKKNDTDRKLKNIRDFLYRVEIAVDASVKNRFIFENSCGILELKYWARSQAISLHPENLEALYERIVITTALSIIAAKYYKYANKSDSSEIQDWLTGLAISNIKIYMSYNLKRNNLYFWLGAMAAGVSFISEHKYLHDFAIRVWQEALSDTKSDGSLPYEMMRGSRSNLYQIYATNALIFLWAFIGDSDLKNNNKKFLSIIDFSVDSLCNKNLVYALTGLKQQPVEEKGLIPLIVFYNKITSKRLPSCFPRTDITFDTNFGGDIKSFELVMSLR